MIIAKRRNLIGVAVLVALMAALMPGVCSGEDNPSGDVTANSARAAGLTPAQVGEAIGSIEVPPPTGKDPVSVVTTLVPSKATPGQEVTVVIKVHVKAGWHIYRYVSPTAPYIISRWELELPPGLEKEGEWVLPPPISLAEDPDIFVYGGEQVFLHKARVLADTQGDLVLTAGLEYQACDVNYCLPPKSKMTDLTITVE